MDNYLKLDYVNSEVTVRSGRRVSMRRGDAYGIMNYPSHVFARDELCKFNLIFSGDNYEEVAGERWVVCLFRQVNCVCTHELAFVYLYDFSFELESWACANQQEALHVVEKLVAEAVEELAT